MSPKKEVQFSPTQIDTAFSCVRKWWFTNVKKVPTEIKDHFTFGSVLHAVVERWYRADDTGRDPEGNEVDLYPDGWQACYNRWDETKVEGVVNPLEADLIQSLVTMAIEKGVLVRHHPRQIELDISKVNKTEIVTVNGQKATLSGFVDLLHGTTIEDHKTCKNFKYSLSPTRLAKDIKMKIYAYWFLDLLRGKGAPDQDINLIHNYYSKEPGNIKIKQVSTSVSPEVLDATWSDVEIIASDMLTLIQEEIKVEDWEEVPKTKKPEVDCNAYGGCPFQDICYRQIATVEAHVIKTERFNKNKEAEMADIFKKFAGKGKKVEEKEPEITEEEEKPNHQGDDDYEDVPPWARPTCKACEGVGFASAGNVCRICLSKWDGDIKKYETGVHESKYLWAGPTEGMCPVPESHLKKQAKDEAKPKPEPMPKVKKGKVIRTEELQPEQDTKLETPEEAAGLKIETDTGRGRGRPKRTFSLLIGVVPDKNGLNTERLETIIAEFHEKVAAELGAGDYYIADPFKRRDAMCKLIVDEMKESKTTTIIVTSKSPDIDAVIAALIPHADSIYHSVGR